MVFGKPTKINIALFLPCIIDANPTDPGALVQYTNPVIQLELNQRQIPQSGSRWTQTGRRILWSIDYMTLVDSKVVTQDMFCCTALDWRGQGAVARPFATATGDPAAFLLGSEGSEICPASTGGFCTRKSLIAGNYDAIEGD